MEETNIFNENDYTRGTGKETNNTPIEVVSDSDPACKSSHKGLFKRISSLCKRWYEISIPKVLSNYTKRNVITNIVLSLYFLISLLMTFIYLFFTFVFISKDPYFFIAPMSAFLIPHVFFLVHTYQFVILNWKESVYKSYASFYISLIPYTYMYLSFTSPDEDGDFFVPSIIIALFIFFIVMAVVSIALQFRKYGASAKMLLDIPRDKSRKMFNYKTFLSVIFFCVCFLSIPLLLYYSPIVINYIQDYDSDYKSVKSAKIGDYYYEDGTLSSELHGEKKCIGVVYSLEVSEYEKERGYKHGHIVAINDEDKTRWTSTLYDVEYLPNYAWENRRDALKDESGLKYYYLRQDYEHDVPELYHYIFNVDQYSTNRSVWYVPTAGEWAEILRNLGDIEVNDMLGFDSETAAKNLNKYNFDEKRWYWAATEQDEKNAWSIRIKNGEFGSRTPKGNAAYIRLVAAF